MTKVDRIYQNIKTLSELLDRGVVTYNTWSIEDKRLRAELARETGGKPERRITDELVDDEEE